MLTKLKEMGREKCAQYWPVDRSVRYGYYIIDPVGEYHMPQYVLNELKLTDSRVRRTKIDRMLDERSSRMVNHERFDTFITRNGRSKACRKWAKASLISSDKCTRPKKASVKMDRSLCTVQQVSDVQVYSSLWASSSNGSGTKASSTYFKRWNSCVPNGQLLSKPR